ncbi:hypothetical protein Noda2021_07440 [Candidatus Dependentiae bacterium Noda2021]|nr:hypothetical protein Noda2021_07440 [Candidatus Dependentiae bacterium Noda2021]
MKKLVMLLLMVNALSLAQTKDKFVIGHHRCGFFSCFFGALNNLMWCHAHKKEPVMMWDSNSLYYDERDPECRDNAWLCFFKPVSNYKYAPGDYVHNSYFDVNGRTWFSIPPCARHRTKIACAIKKWIRLNEHIQQAVNDFYRTYMHGKKTVGIHIRRTDKHVERPDVPLEKIFSTANAIDTDQYLVATDEMEILQAAQMALNKPVIFFPCPRSVDGTPLHYNSECANKTQSGRDVLIEVILLSRTDTFIHTISNVSSAVLCFNPSLKGIELR